METSEYSADCPSERPRTIQSSVDQRRRTRASLGAGTSRDMATNLSPTATFRTSSAPARVRKVTLADGAAGQANRRRRSEFVTTRTELIAIAAPAIIGLSRPSAA